MIIASNNSSSSMELGQLKQVERKERVPASRSWIFLATVVTVGVVWKIHSSNRSMTNYLRDVHEGCPCSQQRQEQQEQQDQREQQERRDKSTTFDTLPRASKIFFPEMIPTPSTLHTVKEYTQLPYEKHMTNVPGVEHYALLYYLSSTYGDERPIIDIGTRVAASALAFAAGGSAVKTFDLPRSLERFSAFRGKSESKWQSKIRAKGLNITFKNVNLMKVRSLEKKLGSTWLICLDTAHLPDTVPFEREWFQRLVQTGYQGLLVLDDIHLNHEMKKWWKEVQDGAQKDGYRTFDLTKIGHHSGTGLVDFSGKAVVQVPQPKVVQ